MSSFPNIPGFCIAIGKLLSVDYYEMSALCQVSRNRYMAGSGIGRCDRAMSHQELIDNFAH
jgi:hypothetical protein